MAENIIAVNTGSYGKYRDGAFAHLERTGVRNVEIPVPARDQLDAVRDRLQAHGLTATSLICPCDLAEDPESMRERLEVGHEMGVRLFFISAKTGGLTKPEAYRRLRARAQIASEYGVTLSLETHPDLGENFVEARATLHAAAHPNLRWNLDTANLHYYNHNAHAVAEASRGASLIASVHLKDTNGAFQCWWFPALGEGVVDFPGVFRVLNETGFRGPFTMELEGIQGEELDETGTHERVERSVAYLRGIGVF